MLTPRLPTRSNSAWNTSTVARASDRARWLGTVSAPKWAASVASLQLRTSSRRRAQRASATVSMTVGRFQEIPSCSNPRWRKPTSKRAL